MEGMSQNDVIFSDEFLNSRWVLVKTATFCCGKGVGIIF